MQVLLRLLLFQDLPFFQEVVILRLETMLVVDLGPFSDK